MSNEIIPQNKEDRSEDKHDNNELVVLIRAKERISKELCLCETYDQVEYSWKTIDQTSHMKNSVHQYEKEPEGSKDQHSIASMKCADFGFGEIRGVVRTSSIVTIRNTSTDQNANQSDLNVTRHRSLVREKSCFTYDDDQVQ